MQPRLRNHAIQHLGFVEAIHRHQPIDDFAVATEGELMRRTHQRNDFPIDVGRKTAIELELGSARRFAPGKRREIEIGKADRLLELVDQIAGQKHLRHVGLVADHLRHRRPINVATHQEHDLIGERRFARRGRLRTWAGCVVLDQHE